MIVREMIKDLAGEAGWNIVGECFNDQQAIEKYRDGWFELGQDEQSSDVYGMNKVAFIEGNVDPQTSLDHMPVAIVVRIGQLPGRRKGVVPLVPVVTR